MAERIDDLLCRGFRIIQDSEGFCFGMDAVLLANYALPAVREGSQLLDLGTGTGVIPLLLSAKTKARRLYGLEIQKSAADLAERSAALNGQEGRIQILRGDIRQIRDFPLSSRMDLVLSNPPYLKSGIRSKGEGRQIARHEILCSFRDVAVAASYLLKASGRFFLVHRAERLTDIVSDLRESGLEPKRLRMVYSRAGREAKLLLLEAVKGGRPQLHVEPPLIVYEEGGVYTEELLSLYRGEAYL